MVVADDEEGLRTGCGRHRSKRKCKDPQEDRPHMKEEDRATLMFIFEQHTS